MSSATPNAMSCWLGILCLTVVLFDTVLGYPLEYHENGVDTEHGVTFEFYDTDPFEFMAHELKELARVDDDGCLKRLICQIGVNPAVFGVYGKDVASMFRNKTITDPEVRQLQKSFNFGVKYGFTKLCKKSNPFCEYTTQDLIEISRKNTYIYRR